MASNKISKSLHLDKFSVNTLDVNTLHVNDKLYVRGNFINNNLDTFQYHDFKYPSMFGLYTDNLNKTSKIQLKTIHRIGISDQSVTTAKEFFNGTLLRFIFAGNPIETNIPINQSLQNNNSENFSLNVLDNTLIYGPYKTNTESGDRRKQIPNPAKEEKLAVVNGIKNNTFKEIEIDNNLTSLFFFVALDDVINLTVTLNDKHIYLVKNSDYSELLEYIANNDNEKSFAGDELNIPYDINNFIKTKNLLEPFEHVEIEFKNNLNHPPLVRTQNINFFHTNFDSYAQGGLLHI